MSRSRASSYVVRSVPVLVVLIAAIGEGCSCGESEGNLFTTSAGTAGAAVGGAGGSSNGGSSSGGSSNGGSSNGGSSNGGSGGMAGAGGGPAECVTAMDCDTLFGPPACGAWTCNAGDCQASSPGCTDADGDGYGAGMGCACSGLDCDDGDATVTDTAQSSCYSGPAGTAGVGTCLSGATTCSAGQWSACVGEVIPSGEACNALDDDCNGTADDGLANFTCGLGACANSVAACTNGAVGVCSPLPAPSPGSDGPACDGVDGDCDGPIDEDCLQCIAVSPFGNDMTANGTFPLPFATIQAAIGFAAANAGPKTVCVAGGATCNGAATYPENVVMANGISVVGSYAIGGGLAWQHCSAVTTTIAPPGAAGVAFPNTVQSTTVLDGFVIDRAPTQTTAGVTVDGATGAILSGLIIQNTPAALSSYAINVINGGDAIVTRGRLDGGNGSVETIGVRSVGSKVSVENNCLSINAAGRCDDFCFNNPSIRGRTTSGTGITHSVLLQDSPGSSIETSALCANDADQGSPIRIAGDATGVLVRGNLVNAFGGAIESYGVWMTDCGDAAPWIVDNHLIASSGDTQATQVAAIRAVGACHPVVDSNVTIQGGGEGQASSGNGVHCAANAQSVPSKCVVLGNALIQGSAFGFPPVSTGVRCDAASCNKIAGNVITGRGGVVAFGVFLDESGAFVDGNVIRGGCSPTATGLHGENAFARVQNNRIFGFSSTDCGPVVNPPTLSNGIHLVLAAGVNEVDVHSNDIDGAGLAAGCTSHGVLLTADPQSPPSSGVGVLRNNIIRAGACNTRYGVLESSATADPRIFESNDLDPFQGPTAFYIDENSTALDAPGVNALMDMIVSGTISVDPLYVAYPNDLHLSPGSPCDGAGTPTGAPALDMDGQPRDPVTPDVGADEL